jgi:hypothetical protein
MRRFFANTQSGFVKNLGYTLRDVATSVKLVISGCCNRVISNMFKQLHENGNISIPEAYNDIEEAFDTQEKEAGIIGYDKEVSSHDNAIEAMRKIVGVFKRDFAGTFTFPKGSEFNDVVDSRMVGKAFGGTIELNSKIPLSTPSGDFVYKYSRTYRHSYHSQIGGYYILNLFNEVRVPEYKVINIPLVGKKTMQKEVEFYTYGDGEECGVVAKSLLSNINDSHKMLENGGSPMRIPGNPSDNMCSAKYCRAFNTNFCRCH